MSATVRRVGDAWQRFFFEAASTSTLAVVRIAYGMVVTVWTATLAPDLDTFFTAGGFLPEHPDSRFGIQLLRFVDTEAGVTALWALLLVAAIALTLGAGTRVAALVVLVLVVSFQRRDPWILNSGDLVLRNLAFFLALAPAGAALSLDRWLRTRRDPRDAFWQHPSRAPWPLRLIQIELSLGYLFAVWAKARGETWNEGTAVGYALRIDDLVRFAPPAFVTEWLPLVNLLTYGTLAVELALAVLVWNRRLRPWVLGAGVAMHLLIDLTVQVGFFSYTVLVAYLAFVPPETMDRVVSAVRTRVGRVADPAAAPSAR